MFCLPFLLDLKTTIVQQHTVLCEEALKLSSCAYGCHLFHQPVVEFHFLSGGSEENQFLKLQRCFRPGQRSSKSGLGSSRGPCVSPLGSTTKSDCPDFSTIKKNHFNCAYDTIFLFTVVFTFCRLNTKC